MAAGYGAKLNVMANDSLIYSVEVPKCDVNDLGNMARISFDTYKASTFALPNVTKDKWDGIRENGKHWSYLRSNVFWYKSGVITSQIVAGTDGVAPAHFSVIDIKIVPDSVPGKGGNKQ